MTTVIVDRKEGKIYSDSRGTTTSISGVLKKREGREYSKVTKIYRIHDHIITGCGSLAILHHVIGKFHNLKWLPSKFFMRNQNLCDNTTVLVTKSCLGRVYTVRYELTIRNLVFGWKIVKVDKEMIDDEYRYTVKGSGSAFAIGALEQGSNPEEAIKIASKHDIYTDYDIKVVSL